MTSRTVRPRSRIRAVRMLIDNGARRYDADRHLERLFAEPASGAAHTDRAAVIARLKRALRAQRQLARAGHWSYDLNRHFGLLQALKAELARARAEPGGRNGSQPATAVADSPDAPPIAPCICDTDTGTDTS